MILTSIFLGIYAIALAARLLWTALFAVDDANTTENQLKIHKVIALATNHEIAAALSEMINKDGAGSWPPRTDHHSWPAPLRPYQGIYLKLIPLLSSAKPSLDDNVNTERRTRFRWRMRKLLADRIDITQVDRAMAAAEAGDWNDFPRECYNGFYCCVAVCRHAYR